MKKSTNLKFAFERLIKSDPEFRAEIAAIRPDWLDLPKRGSRRRKKDKSK